MNATGCALPRVRLVGNVLWWVARVTSRCCPVLAMRRWNDKGPDDVEQARRAFLEALGVCGALAVTFESALLFAAHAMTTTP